MKILSILGKGFEGVTRVVYGAIAVGLIVAVMYLVGGYAYLSGAWGTDTRSYIAMLSWLDKFFPNIPFWYPLAGGGVSLTHSYPTLSFYIVSLVKRVFDLSLVGSLSVVGFSSILIIAISIYAFVSIRFKNQTAALIASVFYLISPISWTWLVDWGFYAEAISHTFVVPAILFWDLFFTSFIKRDYGVKTRIYLLLTTVFLTLATGTHFLSGYAVMGIFYFYLLIYFLLSKGERKAVLIRGSLALLIVGLAALLATMTFTVPFARYSKFAQEGGVTPGPPPSLKDYQTVLPNPLNVAGLVNIKRESFIFGMRNFKFPMIISIFAALGVVFYSWRDKRRWVWVLYALFGVIVSLTPMYYVYFLNKYPLGFIASSLGWRPVFAVTRIAVPIVASLGIVGLASLPFFWVKNKFIKIPVGVVVAVISLALAVYSLYKFGNYPPSLSRPYTYGANGIDLRNIWNTPSENACFPDGECLGFDKDACLEELECSGDNECLDGLVKKYADADIDFLKWCHSPLRNYTAPLAVPNWCYHASLRIPGTTLPAICSPENLTEEKVKSFWENCKKGNFPEYSLCNLGYKPFKEQFSPSNWPALELASNYDPNQGLNETLQKISQENPVARIDLSPYLGGDSMMAPFYNVGRSLSQIHVYLASASLIHRFQGWQQIVYYLNDPQYDNTDLINNIASWFGINYVFDVPNVYTTNEESLFKRAGWELFSGGWGNGIYKFPEKNPLAEFSGKKTVLVIGQSKYAAYDQVLTISLLGTIPYKDAFLIWGKDKVDDYNLEELKKFDTLILQGYTYKSENAADRLLSSYVKDGGNVFIDTGWQYKTPDWESKKTLDIIPLRQLHWTDLGKTSNYSKGVEGKVSQGIDQSKFDPLIYQDGPWGVSTSDSKNLKDWAKVEILVEGKPIVVSGSYGKGRIVWSGMNIFAHSKQKSSLNTEELKLLKNIFNWLTPQKQPQIYNVSFNRPNPDKVVFNLITAFKKTPSVVEGDELNADMSSSFRGDPALKSGEDVIDQTQDRAYLLWKEGYYPDFKAKLNEGGKTSKLNIYRAGPGWALIEIPKLSGSATVIYEYKKPLLESLAGFISASSFAILILLIFEGVRGEKSAISKLFRMLEDFSNKIFSKVLVVVKPDLWLKKDKEESEY